MNFEKLIVKKIALFLSILIGVIGSVLAQSDNQKVFLKAGQQLEYQGKLFLAPHDTVIFLSADEKYEVINTPNNAFYDSLDVRAHRLGDVPGKLVGLLLRKQDSLQRLGDAEQSLNRFKPYSGMIIREIRYQALDVFGPTVFDTTKVDRSALIAFLNSSHAYTKQSKFQNHLLFQKGDSLSPIEVAESERLIRELDYIKNVRIVVVPVAGNSREVDLLLISQDLFPWGVRGAFSAFDDWRLQAWNQNVAGYGNRGSLTLVDDRSLYKTVVVEDAQFGMGNVYGTYIDVLARYHFDEQDWFTQLSAERNFYTDATKYAGGLGLKYVEEEIFDETPNLYVDSLGDFVTHLQVSAWVGRSFIIEKVNNRSLSVAVSYDGDYYFDRPEVSEDTNQLYIGGDEVTFNFNFSKNRYYNARYVNRFGVTEDIPYGMKATLTVGPDLSSFYNRLYLGSEFSQAHYYKSFGYLYNYIGIGGYFRKNSVEQGVININMNYFSNLRDVLKSKTRQHLLLSYVQGINRFYGEGLTMANSLHIKHYTKADSAMMSGTQKLYFEWSSVSYTQLQFLGFKLAGIVGAGVGTIGSSRTAPWNNTYYSAFSVGMLVRNESLVFNTLALKFTYYPVVVNNLPNFAFTISSSNLFNYSSFRTKRPSKVQYY